MVASRRRGFPEHKRVIADCTGAATFTEVDQNGNPGLTATVVVAWDDDMREARFIFTSVVLANGTSLPTAVNGQARKMAVTER